MSKRKNRKNTPVQPTAPTPPPVEEQREEEAENTEPEPSEEPKARVRVRATGVIAPRAPRSVRASRQAEASGRSSTANRKSDTLDPAYVRERLANPTIAVTEAELRQQYGYVVKDLRSTGLLAVALAVALIILAQILPK